MGISSMPCPGDAGIMCVLFYNTATLIEMLKTIIPSLFRMLARRLSLKSEPESESESDSDDLYIKEFREQVPAIRFDSCDSNQERECRVCLTRFEPKSMVSQLGCGHVFHKLCVEKWLGRWKLSCPLCRTPIMQQAEDDLVLYDDIRFNDPAEDDGELIADDAIFT